MSLVDLALLLCPREFRDGYRREFRKPAASQAFDLAWTGIALRYESLARDAALALRSLVKAPLFSVVAVLTLAIAISVNAVTVAALNAILLKPLPFVQPQKIALLCFRPVSQNCGQLDNGVIGMYRQHTKTLRGIAAFQFFPETLLGHGAPQALQVYASSPNVFDVLGVKPELGRFFDPAHWFGRIVLSDALWRSAFGARRDVVGSIVSLGGSHWEVIGVAPPGTYMPTPGTAPQLVQTLWLAFPPDSFGRLGAFNDWAFARISPNVSPAAAAADVDRVTGQVIRRFPAQEKGLSVAAVPASSFYYADSRTYLLLILAAAFAVLLIACANVANLVLVRCMTRSGEFAVRNALGAARSRVLQQVAVEIAALACAGGVLGVLLGVLELRGLAAVGSDQLVPGVGTAAIDARVMAFVFAVIVIATVLAGVVPAIVATRRNLTEMLKPDGRGGDASRTTRFRTVLGVGQIALAFSVIVTSGLLYRSFISLADAPLGLDTQNVYYFETSFYGPRFHEPAARADFIRALLARLRALPNVESAAAARPNPYLPDGAEGDSFKLPGRSYRPGTSPHALLTQISPRYFAVLHVPLLAGRAFTEADNAASQPIAIVDEHLAKRYFGTRNPIGATILAPVLNGADPVNSPYEPVTVVGIVRDIPVFGGHDAPRLYVPESQNPSRLAQIFVKTRVPDPHVRSQLAAAVASVDPREAIDTFGSLQQRIAHTIAPQKALAQVAGAVALIALILALAGIYAIIAYSAEQQRHEFGVRAAVGARRTDIVRVVLRRAVWIGTLGIAAGLVLAALAGRFVATQLFNVSALDPVTFIVVPVIVFLSVLLASLVPAIQATRIDPAVAIRYE